MEWLQLGLLFLAVAIWAPRQWRKFWPRWQAFRAWEAAQAGAEAPAVAETPVGASLDIPAGAPTKAALTAETTPGAGAALATAPADLRVDLHELITRGGNELYSFPIGWCRVGDKPALLHAALVDDVNHILITGYTDSGKDSWARNMLLSLALRHKPEQLQFALIDGKGGLDWMDWANKAHVWLAAEKKADIPAAMQAVAAERERRTAILKAAKCRKWDLYQGGDLPLLVVYVSELQLLQDATSKNDLAEWLNTELTSCRALGIRFVIGSQTVTRLDTRWRSQIGLYVAGYQPRDDADEPNLCFTAKQVAQLGTKADGTVVAVAPSQLPEPKQGGVGVFTVAQGRTVLTVRATYASEPHVEWLLSMLPEQPAVVPVAAPERPAEPLLQQLLAKSAIAHQNAEKATSDRYSDSTPVSAEPAPQPAIANLVIAADVVPADEQSRILATAPTVSSRRQLAQKLYNVTGGPKYTWVQLVCNAAGLLMPPQPQKEAA